MSFSEPQWIAIRDINLAGKETQVRESVRHDHVDDLVIVAGHRESDNDWPFHDPVDLFCDGVLYWISRGWHRILACEKAGMTHILARVASGEASHAVIHALQEMPESQRGFTRADRRCAIRKALEFCSEMSNYRIAQLTGVTYHTVEHVRECMEAEKTGKPKPKHKKVRRRQEKEQLAKQEESPEFEEIPGSPISQDEESLKNLDPSKDPDGNLKPPDPRKSVVVAPAAARSVDINKLKGDFARAEKLVDQLTNAIDQYALDRESLEGKDKQNRKRLEHIQTHLKNARSELTEWNKPYER